MSEVEREERAGRRKFFIFLLIVAIAVALVAIGPKVLDRYTVNILIRSFLYAIAVLTVDVLWGYTGILTFGQSAFFGGVKMRPENAGDPDLVRRQMANVSS